MNRRTFFKITAASAVGLVVAPTTAQSLKPRWISFTEQLPKERQKVAVFTLFSNNNQSGKRSILTGTVLPFEKFGRQVPEEVIRIDIILSFCPDGDFPPGTIEHNYFIGKRINVAFYSRSDETGNMSDQLKEAEWVEKGKMLCIRHIGAQCIAYRRKSSYININASYWIPIDRYVPKHLPKFPEPQP